MPTRHEDALLATIARLEARIAALESPAEPVDRPSPAPPATRRQLLWAGAAAVGGVAAATLPAAPAVAVNGDPMLIGSVNSSMTSRTSLTAAAPYSDSVVLTVNANGAGGVPDAFGIQTTGRGTSPGLRAVGGAVGGVGADGQGGSGLSGIGVRGTGGTVTGSVLPPAGVAGIGGNNNGMGPGGPGVTATGGNGGPTMDPGHGLVASAGPGTGSASGVVATGNGFGPGVQGTGGDSSAPGVRGTGGPGDGHGVVGQGTGSGSGLLALGGTTGVGLDARGGSGGGAGLVASSTGGAEAARLVPAADGPHLLLLPKATAGAPSTGSHLAGELWLDSDGVIWVCTTPTPGAGTWKALLTEVPEVPPTPAPSGLVTLLPQPVRLLSAKIAAGRSSTLVIAGRMGVPAGATGAVLTFSTVKPKKNGSVRIYPAGIPAPAASATLTYAKKADLSLGATVRLGTGGAVVVGVAGGTTRVNVDVTAYIK